MEITTGPDGRLKTALENGDRPLAAHATIYVAVDGDDTNDGLTLGDAKRTWAAAIAALPADGGTMVVAAGIYDTAATVVIPAGKPIEVISLGKVTLRASGGIVGPVLRYHKITERPNVGARGVILDMNNAGGGGASIGLEVRDCWATEHHIRVINPGGGTGARVVAEDVAFGCFYNRVYGQVRGTDVAGSIGGLIEGAGAGNAANANQLGLHVTDMATGIKIGTFTDANFLDNCDCTGCTIGYDFTSGVTLGDALWEETNTTEGFIVRAGAKAILDVLYREKVKAETTGLLVVRHNGLTEVQSNSAMVDHSVNVPGNWTMRHRFDPAAGRYSWIEDGVGTMFEVDGNGARALRGTLGLPTYTLATRPAAGGNAGRVIYVSDALAGQKFQGSDGVAWVPLG